MSFFDDILRDCPPWENVYKSFRIPISTEVRKICAKPIERLFLLKKDPLTQMWSLKTKWDWEFVDRILGIAFLIDFKNTLDDFLKKNPNLEDLHNESLAIKQASETRLGEFIREICTMVKYEISWRNQNTVINYVPKPPQSNSPDQMDTEEDNQLSQNQSEQPCGPQYRYDNVNHLAIQSVLIEPSLNPSSLISEGIGCSQASTSDKNSTIVTPPEHTSITKPESPPIPSPSSSMSVSSDNEETSGSESSDSLPYDGNSFQENVTPKLNSLATELQTLSNRSTLEIQKIIYCDMIDKIKGLSGDESSQNHKPCTITSQIASLIQPVEKSHTLFKEFLDLLTNPISIKNIWNYLKQCKAIGLKNITCISLKGLYPPCKIISQSFYTILQSIDQLKRQLSHETEILEDLITLFKQGAKLFKSFLQMTFLVKKQPPMTIAPKEHFSPPENPLSVSLLCCSSLPFLKSWEDHVQISLMNEMHAKSVADKGLESLKEVVKDAGKLGKFSRQDAFVGNYDSGKTSPPSAVFFGVMLSSNMGNYMIGIGDFDSQLKSYILFTFKVNLFGKTFSIWTTSLPIYVSPNRKSSLKAQGMPVIIRNYLRSPLERNFDTQHSDAILWSQLSQVIQILFKNTLEDDEMKLNEEQLNFIKDKVTSPETSTSHKRIGWVSLFSNPYLPGVSDRKFTFWEWLLSCFQTLSFKNMAKMWKDGLIIGFIDKVTAEDKLRGTTIGTFLLRFSTSVPGGLSIVVVKLYHIPQHLTPFTMEELRIQSLSNLIKEKEAKHYLQFFYGHVETPKDELLKIYGS